MPDLKVGGHNVTELIHTHLCKKEPRVFMLEVPEEKYFLVNLETVRVLVDNGFSGVYISLNRPYDNLMSIFKDKNIQTDKLAFIDAASSQAGIKKGKNVSCAYIDESIKIDELTRSVYQMLQTIKGEQKFLFIDSITTLLLYQPLSETLRFAEFLKRSVEKGEFRNVVVNVPKDLTETEVIKEVVMLVNEVVSI